MIAELSSVDIAVRPVGGTGRAEPGQMAFLVAISVKALLNFSIHIIHCLNSMFNIRLNFCN